MAPKLQLFAHEELGPKFQMKRLVELVTMTNETPEQVKGAIHHLIARRYVENRGAVGAGENARNLFALADAATCKILRTLTSMGITGKASEGVIVDALRAASLACYAWKDGNTGHHVHPITQAIVNTAKAESKGLYLEHMLRIDFYQSEAIGIIYASGDESIPADFPTATIFIPLRELLLPLVNILRAFVREQQSTKH